jgi:hypothetical protein
VTASEFAFLALGLILGIATGAALIEVLRVRAPASREVRVTVARNSIHARRAATLADDGFPDATAGPATGGPGDRRWNDLDPATTDVAARGRRADDRAADTAPHGDFVSIHRTSVQESPAVPAPVPPAAATVGVSGLMPEADDGHRPRTADATTLPARPALMWLSPASAGSASGLVAVPMSLEPDPITQALRSTAAQVAVASMVAGSDPRNAPGARTETASTTDPGGNAGGDASPARVASSTASSAEGTTDAGVPQASEDTSDGGPCAEERRVAAERCAVAVRAREGAAGAAEALRVAHRTYDTHVGNAETAAATIDPRSVRAAKELAQRRFRDSRAAAATNDDVEAAARTWLGEINHINRETREAGVRIERDRAAATALAPVLERLAVQADAARISAERADEACIAAREAVAACDEARMREIAAAAAGPILAPSEDRIAAAMPPLEQAFEPSTPMGSRAGVDATLLRILRGDRDAMLAAVARLGGDDPDARRRWQEWLSGLAEALIARAIEAAAFDFPLDHFFWGPFSQTQNRDIAAALSSIGHRFDGFGGWVDERVPSQRDLSMAVGYAGLDPMRIRRWPTEGEMRELMSEVRVAADEYVAAAAGGLTLGELVTLLGRRADGLTELWNEWGIARPILLEAG